MQKGQKRIVWRCISRLDYGKKYCHTSPTLDEEPLKRAVLNALNSQMSDKDTVTKQLSDAIEQDLIFLPDCALQVSDIEQRLTQLKNEFRKLMQLASDTNGMEEYADQFRSISVEMSGLKEQRKSLQVQLKETEQAIGRTSGIIESLQDLSPRLTEWNEGTIRQLVTSVRVLSANKIQVSLTSGIQIEQEI